MSKTSLSLVSSQQATTLAVAVRDVASVAYSFSPRGTLSHFRHTDASSAHSRSTRKHFRVRSSNPNHGEKLRKSHFFLPFKTLGPGALAQQDTTLTD